MTVISAVPTTYNGVRYRSALEADWAAMFTRLGIYFEYEPQPWRMPSGALYDPDFYLPTMRTYCEAKGPHNERLWKPEEFAAALATVGYPREFQVVLLRPPGPHGEAVWELASDGPTPMLTFCDGCRNWAFTDVDETDYYCRRCWSRDVLTHACWTGGPRNVRGLGCIDMARVPRRAKR